MTHRIFTGRTASPAPVLTFIGSNDEYLWYRDQTTESSTNDFRRFSTHMGGPIWTTTAGFGDESRIAIAGDKLLLGQQDGTVRCYGPTGSLIWTYTPAQTQGYNLSQIVPDTGSGRVYLAFYNVTNHARCLDLDDGSLIWSVNHGVPGHDYDYHAVCCLPVGSNTLWGVNSPGYSNLFYGHDLMLLDHNGGYLGSEKISPVQSTVEMTGATGLCLSPAGDGNAIFHCTGFEQGSDDSRTLASVDPSDLSIVWEYSAADHGAFGITRGAPFVPVCPGVIGDGAGGAVALYRPGTSGTYQIAKFSSSGTIEWAQDWGHRGTAPWSPNAIYAAGEQYWVVGLWTDYEGA